MLPLGIVWVFLTGFAVVVRSWARASTDPMPTLLTWAAVIIGVFALLYLVAPLFGDRDPEDSPQAPGEGGRGAGGGFVGTDEGPDPDPDPDPGPPDSDREPHDVGVS
jgi:hypothetical protein